MTGAYTPDGHRRVPCCALVGVGVAPKAPRGDPLLQGPTPCPWESRWRGRGIRTAQSRPRGRAAANARDSRWAGRCGRPAGPGIRYLVLEAHRLGGVVGSRWQRLGVARQAGERLRSRSALAAARVCQLAASAQSGRFATPAVVTAASRGRLRRDGGLIPESQVPSWPRRLALELVSSHSRKVERINLPFLQYCYMHLNFK